MAKVTSTGRKQQALVIGVSSYSPPLSKLPAVVNDVREMARLLASSKGAFSKDELEKLIDRSATKDAVVASLKQAFSTTSSFDTLFVYLAGHGTVIGDQYFFLPYDTNHKDIENSAIPLKSIKRLFDRCASRQVLLWLDFCHSGGVLARRAASSPMASLRRELKVTKGEGKVIFAACTSSQSSFESSAIGHGVFTDALLRGLKGAAKSAQGEVTISSLFDFIDHEIGSSEQRPVFSGEMTGRMVLMHYGSRKGVTPKLVKTKAKTSARKAPKKLKGTWILLGEHFYLATQVRNASDGSVSIEVTPRSGEEEARIAGLRPRQYGGAVQVPFAVNNDAYEVAVEEVVTEHAGTKPKWLLKLRQHEQNRTFMEMTVNGVGPDELARLRAGRLLLNDPPVRSTRGYDRDAMIESHIVGQGSKYSVDRCVIQEIYSSHGAHAYWRDLARLKAVLLLKMTGTVEHVVVLKIGALKSGKVKVEFTGRRSEKYSNREPTQIDLNGECKM